MSVLLPVHVTPRGGRDEVAGWRDGELQVRVAAPPEGGKANAAVCAAVARALRVPKTSIAVRRGEGSRHKLLEIAGLTAEDLDAALGNPEE